MMTLQRLAFAVVASLLALLPGCSSSPLEHVAVIGASVSAGVSADITVTKPDGTRSQEHIDLADALVAAAPSIKKIESFADYMYFMNPVETGTRHLDEALATHPTAIVAVDDLFWHVYGAVKSEDERLSRLNKRLERYATISVPLVIGDIPDMSPASPGMLQPSWLPKPETRTRANQIIHEFAASHASVALVPLSAIIEGARAGDVSIASTRMTGADATSLIARDKLHASAKGLAALACECVSQLTSKRLIPTSPVPSVTDVAARLSPRQAESKNSLSLLDLLTLKDTVSKKLDKSDDMGIELMQAHRAATDPRRISLVADRLPTLWTDAYNAKFLFDTSKYTLVSIAKACIKADPACRDRLIALRSRVESQWRSDPQAIDLLALVTEIDAGLSEAPRMAREVRAVAAGAKKNTLLTPREIELAWWVFQQSTHDQRATAIDVFPDPVAEADRLIKDYTEALERRKTHPPTSFDFFPETRRSTFYQCAALAEALRRANRETEAEQISIKLQALFGTDQAPPTVADAVARLQPAELESRFIACVRLVLSFDTLPENTFPPLAYADSAESIAQQLPAVSAVASNIKPTIAALVDERVRLIAWDTPLQAEWANTIVALDISTDRPAAHAELIRSLVSDVTTRNRVLGAAFKLQQALATSDPTLGATLFNDYDQWPALARSAIESARKDSADPKHTAFAQFLQADRWFHSLTVGATCLRAAGRLSEADTLENAAREIRWPEPAWLASK